MKKPVNGVGVTQGQGTAELIAFTKVRSPQSLGSNQYALFDSSRASNRGAAALNYNQLQSTTSQDSNRARKLITFE